MSDLKNKLYNYEQIPPAKLWDKITAALDESNMTDEFPAKLYNTEVAPPAMVWDKIVNSLDKESPKVISLPRSSFPFFRYAAAAVVIGLITFVIVKWTGSNKPAAEDLAASGKNLSPGNTGPGLPVENTAPKSNEQKENTVPEASNPQTADDSQVKASPIRKAKVKYAISEDITPVEEIYAYNEPAPNLADRYVMLMTPNGIVRMSKKLGSIVCCVAGQEQDEDCKDQIKKWQEKLAASPVAPAPGNFMDILSLVSSLDENEL